MKSLYWALIHHEDGAFGISFPDVPGCVSAAETLEDVLDSGSEALSSHLALMRAEGDRVPSPRSYAALQEDPETGEIASGAIWHQIAARTVQAPRVRINIVIDPGLLRETDEAARADGLTRSGLIEVALGERLIAWAGRTDPSVRGSQRSSPSRPIGTEGPARRPSRNAPGAVAKPRRSSH